MPLRSLVVAFATGAAALASSAALGAPADCVACYRLVVRPPVHGVVSERVPLHPGQTLARTVLPRYETVTEKVLVSPRRNVWQVKRGPRGETVGCWVVAPAQYAVRHRAVMVRPAYVGAEAIPAARITRTRSAILHPGGSAWEPIARSVKR